MTGGIDDLDDFAACKITRKEDWVDLYAKPYYFGCEADDRMNATAFGKGNPFGAQLNAIYSSDIGHFDVIDMRDPLPEAYELVEDGYITERQFPRLRLRQRGAAVGHAEPALLRRHARRQGSRRGIEGGAAAGAARGGGAITEAVGARPSGTGVGRRLFRPARQAKSPAIAGLTPMRMPRPPCKAAVFLRSAARPPPSLPGILARFFATDVRQVTRSGHIPGLWSATL